MTMSIVYTHQQIVAKTPDEWRAVASVQAQQNAARLDSDVDGMGLSYWATGLYQQAALKAADLAEDGGLYDFLTLVDAATGQPVEARIINTRFGSRWLVKTGPAYEDVKFLNVVGYSPAGQRDYEIESAVERGEEREAATARLTKQYKRQIAGWDKRTAALLAVGYREDFLPFPACITIRGSGTGLAGAASCQVYVERQMLKVQEA